MSTAELVLRLIVAAALGAAVGAERQLAGEPAGLRVHTLVAMGAALLTLASRAPAEVVIGVGLLGAAGVLRSGATVPGVAGAASLWVVGAVGVATAFGQWTLAVVASAVAVVVLRGLTGVETAVARRWRARRAELSLGLSPGQDVEALVKRIGATGVAVRGFEVSDGEAGRSLRLALEVPAHLSPDTAADAARPVAQVRALTWSV